MLASPLPATCGSSSPTAAGPAPPAAHGPSTSTLVGLDRTEKRRDCRGLAHASCPRRAPLQTRQGFGQGQQSTLSQVAFPVVGSYAWSVLSRLYSATSRHRPERVGQRRFHVTRGQAADVPGDDQRLQRVGLGHVAAEQPRGERGIGAAQLRAFEFDRSGGGLHGHVAVAVALPCAGAVAARVALTAEELGDLGLQRGLQDQPCAEARDVLEHLAQAAVLGEQRVDLVADPLGRRYSCWHGRSSFLTRLGTSVRNLRPCPFYTEDETRPAAAERLRSFDLPALVIWASEDRVMPPEHGRRLAELLPHGRLIEIADSYTLIPLFLTQKTAYEIRHFVHDTH